MTDTLQELQREKLITRESFAEIPPRVEYSLTEGRGATQKRDPAFAAMGINEDHRNQEEMLS